MKIHLFFEGFIYQGSIRISQQQEVFCQPVLKYKNKIKHKFEMEP